MSMSGRKHKRQEIDELDQVLISKLDKLQDREGTFGDHVASCLRQLNPCQRAIARVEIDKLLLNMQFPEDGNETYFSTDYYTFNA